MKKINYYKCALVKERELDYRAVKSSDDIYKVMRDLGYATADEEYCLLFCLNAKGDITGIHEVSHGSITSAPVSSVCVFKRAILNNSTAIIVAHNHPSGDIAPSECDIRTTESLVNGGRLLGIKVLDHIIVADNDYHSLHDDIDF